MKPFAGYVEDSRRSTRTQNQHSVGRIWQLLVDEGEIKEEPERENIQGEPTKTKQTIRKREGPEPPSVLLKTR